MSDTLKGEIIRLAHEHPEHRDELLGVLKRGGVTAETQLEVAAHYLMGAAKAKGLKSTLHQMLRASTPMVSVLSAITMVYPGASPAHEALLKFRAALDRAASRASDTIETP